MTDLFNASNGAELNEAEEPMVLTHEQYEEMKRGYETIIARGSIARKLATNDDFKELIMTGYLKEEPERLAELIASGRITNQMTLDNAAKGIHAVGFFRNFMRLHIEQGDNAAAELAGLEEAYELALAEPYSE